MPGMPPAPSELLEKLRNALDKGFQDTRVPESFIGEVLEPARQIIENHCCLVLGPAGAGKTSLVKALVPDFHPRIEPGPLDENKTMEAQSVDLKLDMMENLKVVMIDTRGWSPNTSTNVKSEYKQILKERKLVSEHTPHIILFCIPASMIRQFDDEEAKKMSHQLQELKFDQCFPIKVLPVATKADCEDHNKMDDICKTIKNLADKAFEGTGADVEDTICTKRPFAEIAEVKDRLQKILTDQIKSDQFRDLCHKVFAKSLAEHTRIHCEQFPEGDSAIRLYKNACDVVESICKRKNNSPNQAMITSQDVLHLPWLNIEKIAGRRGDAWADFQAAKGPKFLCLWLTLAILTLLSWCCCPFPYTTLVVGTLSFVLLPFIWMANVRSSILRRWVPQCPPYWAERRSTWVQSRVLAILLVLVVLVLLGTFSWEHHAGNASHIMEKELVRMKNQAKATQQQLGALKRKFKIKQAEVDKAKEAAKEAKQLADEANEKVKDEKQREDEAKEEAKDAKQLADEANEKVKDEKQREDEAKEEAKDAKQLADEANEKVKDEKQREDEAKEEAKDAKQLADEANEKVKDEKQREDEAKEEAKDAKQLADEANEKVKDEKQREDEAKEEAKDAKQLADEANEKVKDEKQREDEAKEEAKDAKQLADEANEKVKDEKQREDEAKVKDKKPLADEANEKTKDEKQSNVRQFLLVIVTLCICAVVYLSWDYICVLFCRGK